MRMAVTLAQMPDLWHRTLVAHQADDHGYCRDCRGGPGVAARWPCLPYQVAWEAKYIYEGGLPGTQFAVPQQRRPGRAPTDRETLAGQRWT